MHLRRNAKNSSENEDTFLLTSKTCQSAPKYFLHSSIFHLVTMKRDRKGKVVRKRKRRRKKRLWQPSSHYSRGGDFLSMLVTVQEDKGDPFVNHRSKQAASSSSSPAASASSAATSSTKSKPKRFAAKLDRMEEPLGQDDADAEDFRLLHVRSRFESSVNPRACVPD